MIARVTCHLKSIVRLLLAICLGVGTPFVSSHAEEFAQAKESVATTRPSTGPRRLVSLNPSLSAIVLRLGEGDRLVGVDDYSARLMPELAKLPRVGGLFDPGLESILSLRPDRVLLVAGLEQETHAARLEKLGVKVEIYSNERLDEVLENIERLGTLLGHDHEAESRIRAILEMRRAVAVAAMSRHRPTSVAIIDRSPLFIVGSETFLDEMLDAVGAENLGRELAKGYPRGSIEWLIAARPERLLDMTPGATAASEFWSRWPSIPAVANGQVIDVDASRVSLPGPDLDMALLELAVAVHGEGIKADIRRALREQSVAASPRDAEFDAR
jgi:ABC-type Fe3+-hydroxamate transport system substrate-binding protein